MSRSERRRVPDGDGLRQPDGRQLGMPLPRAARAMLCTLLLTGCSPTPEGEGALVLGWTFVDGRRCAESGVEQVALLSLPEEEKPVLLSTCASGHGAPVLEVTLPAGDHTLRVDGISAASSVLYRATRQVTMEDGARVVLKAKLVFIGGI